MTRPRIALAVALPVLLAPTSALLALGPVGAASAATTDIVINEVAQNVGDTDWVELKNTGTDAVDVSGWRLYDDKDDRAFALAEGTVIEAGGYLVVDTDVDAEVDGAVREGFGLGRADEIRLYAAGTDPADGTPIDAYAWSDHALTADGTPTTYGRLPDGTGAFAVTGEPTRGAANVADDAQTPEPSDPVDPADLPSVVVNEVESSGGTPSDWLELHNTGDAEVDLSGYLVSDSDPTHLATLPEGSVIAAGGYLVVEELTLGFGLGSDDAARLLTPDGATVVDERSWSGHAATTYGRCGTEPDVTWQETTVPTKGAANDCGSTVRINEIESSGGSPGDWIELVNIGEEPVDISGWVLSDSDDDHRFTVPAGTTIEPDGYWVADVDADSLGEAAFGLGGDDAARLFDADGAAVDAYAWTSHAATTYGRCPDGTGTFTTTAEPTRGAANVCEGEEEQTPREPWPGPAEVAVADPAGTFAENLSGLVYADDDTLWAVQNNPGSLHRLVRDGAEFVPDPDWNDGTGISLHYPDGTGNVDAEGVTVGPAAPGGATVYVASERDNDGSGSRPSILAYAPAADPADPRTPRTLVSPHKP